MRKEEKVWLDRSLLIFLTLVIMNSVKFIGIVATLGSVGKFLFCILFIAIIFALVDKEKYTIQFIFEKSYFVITGLLLLFSFLFIFKTGTRANLLPNLAFPLYFLLYYYFIKLYIRANKNNTLIDTINAVKFQILSIYRKTLFLNFIFWFIVAIGLGINMWEVDGGFGGFFQDEIHFGFYVVTGFLVSFYFRFNTTFRDLSRFNLLLLCMYGGIALFTSRNSFLIIAITLFFYFFIFKIKNRFLKVFTFFSSIILVILSIIAKDLSEADIIEITSGRYNIWALAFDKITNTNYLLLGDGLFNLNDVILQNYKGVGFYYLDSLDSLSFHSSYIELLAAGGLFAVVLFVRIISKSWISFNRVEKSMISGMLVGAMFESFLVQPFMLLASLFYFIVIINNMVIPVIKKNSKIVKLRRDFVINR